MTLASAAGCVPAARTASTNTPIPLFLNPASPIAARQASLFWILLAMSAVVFLIVEGLLIYNVLYHAKQPEDERTSRPSTTARL